MVAAQPNVSRPHLKWHAPEVASSLRQRHERVPIFADYVGQLLIRERLEIEVKRVAGEDIKLLQNRRLNFRRRLDGNGSTLFANVRPEGNTLNYPGNTSKSHHEHNHPSDDDPGLCPARERSELIH